MYTYSSGFPFQFIPWKILVMKSDIPQGIIQENTVYQQKYKETIRVLFHHMSMSYGLVWFGLCCLMTPGLSKDIRCHVWPYFFKTCKCQIRHQATHKMGCQPGVCIWSLQYSSGVWVGIYGLTYSLMTPEGCQCHMSINITEQVLLVRCSVLLFSWIQV